MPDNAFEKILNREKQTREDTISQIVNRPQPAAPASTQAPMTKRMTPVPASVVTLPNKVKVITYPDGREFSINPDGTPARSDRSELTSAVKREIRGGQSFAESDLEVDHRVPIALGGTNVLSNLQALRNERTIWQKTVDFFTGNDRESVGDFNFELRQEGKAAVESRAIQKYQDGEITLSAAQAAVNNWDDPEIVAGILSEEMPQPLSSKVGGVLGKDLNVLVCVLRVAT